MMGELCCRQATGGKARAPLVMESYLRMVKLTITIFLIKWLRILKRSNETKVFGHNYHF